MTSYKPALRDGSDPTYAPGLNVSNGISYWRPPPKYRKHGFKAAKVSGTPLEIAAKCRALTREMLDAYEGEDKQSKPGTWGDLIAHYRADEFSPMQEVSGNTRKTYAEDIAYWEAAVGKQMVSGMTFFEAKKIIRMMQEKGRSDHFIRAKVSTLRRLANYGVALRFPGADDTAKALSEVRTPAPAHRTASPTEAQILAVANAADEAGETGFATGLLFQWWLALRAMDVRGDYIPLAKDEAPTGICRGRARWSNGLTWDLFSKDLTSLTKVPSKTRRKMPEPITWDMTHVPELRARLLSIPTDKRVGPVIIDKTGMPYSRWTYADLWRRFSEKAGLPEGLRAMDIRAGAINDGKRKGASKIELQQAANHKSGATTEIYIREQNEAVNNVLQIRVGTKAQQ